MISIEDKDIILFDKQAENGFEIFRHEIGPEHDIAMLWQGLNEGLCECPDEYIEFILEDENLVGFYDDGVWVFQAEVGRWCDLKYRKVGSVQFGFGDVEGEELEDVACAGK